MSIFFQINEINDPEPSFADTENSLISLYADEELDEFTNPDFSLVPTEFLKEWYDYGHNPSISCVYKRENAVKKGERRSEKEH